MKTTTRATIVARQSSSRDERDPATQFHHAEASFAAPGDDEGAAMPVLRVVRGIRTS
jgi:hypothetical protein